MTPSFGSKFHRYYGYFLMAREKARKKRDPLNSRFEARKARFYQELWARAANDIGATVETLDDDYYRIWHGDRSTFVRRSNVMLDSRVLLDVAGHKPLSLKLFSEAGFPVPRHMEFRLDDLQPAIDWQRQLGKPVVVKPAVAGSAGQGITTGVDSEKRLKRAAVRGTAHGTRLLAEEQISGESYRILYLNGEYLDAVRRCPPTVRGDGKSTIRSLVDAENEFRLSGDYTSMHPLSIDLEMASHLKEGGRDLDTVLQPDEVVAVKRVVNQNASRENICVREIVHPSTIDAGRRAAEIFGIELAGFDVLTPDITKPLAEVGGVINEVNTTPALHHHYLISEPDRAIPVAARVLEYILKS